MKYWWTEDTGAGLHFWKLVNQLFFHDTLVIESKESNQGILDAFYDRLSDIMHTRKTVFCNYSKSIIC